MGRKKLTRSFQKLKGSENYREWAREMTSTLQTAELMGHVTGTVTIPTPYSGDSMAADHEEKYEKRQEAIDDWIRRDSQAVGTMGLMCTPIVQLDFKPCRSAKDTWDLLQTRYTPSSKWEVLNTLNAIQYNRSEGVQVMGQKVKDVLEAMHELKITIEDYIVHKTINSLGPELEIYAIILRKRARNENKLPDLSTLLRDLEEEVSMKN